MDKRKSETELLAHVCDALRKTRSLTPHERTRLLSAFGARFRDAELLVTKKRVKKFLFKPSRRVLWLVRGRKAKYQVIPDSNFCSCDDYYFRVMSEEKGLCYHIIAQRLAQTICKYETEDVSDEAYSQIVSGARTTTS